MFERLLSAIRHGDPDACLAAGLLLERARGRDVARLLAQEGLEVWSPLVLGPEDRLALLSTLQEDLLKPAFPTEVIWALKADASSEALRPLLGYLRRRLAGPERDPREYLALNAILSIDWPEAEEAVKLALNVESEELREEAQAWLESRGESHR